MIYGYNSNELWPIYLRFVLPFSNSCSSSSLRISLSATSLTSLVFPNMKQSLWLLLVWPSFWQYRSWWNLHLSRGGKVPLGFLAIDFSLFFTCPIVFFKAMPVAYPTPSAWSFMSCSCIFFILEVRAALLRNLPSPVIALSVFINLSWSILPNTLLRFSFRSTPKAKKICSHTQRYPVTSIAAASATLASRELVLE